MKEPAAIALVPVAPIQQLTELAASGKLDVASLERLLDMHERIMARDARTAFVEAMAAFQAACPTIKKTKVAKVVSKRTGSSYSYRYAPLEEIVRTVRPILARHGLSYSFDGSTDGKTYTAVATLRHTMGHEESARFTVPVEDTGQKSGPQEMGSARSYARRYALGDVLGLATAEDDDDGVSAGGTVVETITPEQAAEIHVLAEDVGANLSAFLGWLGGYHELSEIPAHDYARAVEALERKRRGSE